MVCCQMKWKIFFILGLTEITAYPVPLKVVLVGLFFSPGQPV